MAFVNGGVKTDQMSSMLVTPFAAPAPISNQDPSGEDPDGRRMAAETGVA